MPEQTFDYPSKNQASASSAGTVEGSLGGPAAGANTALAESGAGDRPAFNFEGQNAGRASSANALKSKAVGKLAETADARKSMVSDQLKQVSGALSAIGGQSGGQGNGQQAPQWLSKGVQQVTQVIDRFADKVENQNSADLMREAREFARANPALFLGACAAIGFAATRVLSAGGDSA